MVPETSVPGTMPRRRGADFQSTGFTPAARTLMRTSPAPGRGTGRVCTDSAPPSTDFRGLHFFRRGLRQPG